MGMVTEKIKAEEGFKDRPYMCPTGHLTIGYGINLESTPIPKEVADLWLRMEVDKIIDQLSKYEWFSELSYDRHAVIIDMAYQLGVSGVLKFKKMIHAIKWHNWEAAASEMLDSKWAKQTPERANRNATVMRTGSL